MNLSFVFLQAAGGGDYSFLIMMVAIFAIMYFFMIRPQNKKQKEIANFRKNLEVGQDISYVRQKEHTYLLFEDIRENQKLPA